MVRFKGLYRKLNIYFSILLIGLTISLKILVVKSIANYHDDQIKSESSRILEKISKISNNGKDKDIKELNHQILTDEFLKEFQILIRDNNSKVIVKNKILEKALLEKKYEKVTFLRSGYKYEVNNYDYWLFPLKLSGLNWEIHVLKDISKDAVFFQSLNFFLDISVIITLIVFFILSFCIYKYVSKLFLRLIIETEEIKIENQVFLKSKADRKKISLIKRFMNLLNKRLKRRYKNKEKKLRKDLILLSSIGELIVKSENLSKDFLQIYNKLTKILPCDVLSIIYLNKDEKKVTCEYTIEKGIVLPKSEHTYIPTENLSSYAFSEKDFLKINNSQEIKKYISINSAVQKTSKKIESMVYIPLKLNNCEAMITFQSYKRNQYTEDIFQIVQQIANFFSVGIINNQTKRSLKNNVIKDSLTNVYNRYYLKEKFKMSNTYNNIGVIIIDIDFYKTFNDYYGHPKGDLVLYEIAQLMKQVFLEKNEHIIRYGGDEFLIILEGVTKKEVIEKIKKLKKKVTNKNIEHKKSKISKIVTLSMGAVFSKKNTCIKELVSQADLTLYKVKEGGRDNYLVSDVCNCNTIKVL